MYTNTTYDPNVIQGIVKSCYRSNGDTVKYGCVLLEIYDHSNGKLIYGK